MIQQQEFQRRRKLTTNYVCQCGKAYHKKAKLQMHSLKAHMANIKSFKVNYCPQSITYFVSQQQPINSNEVYQQARPRIQSEKQVIINRREKLIEKVGQQVRIDNSKRCTSEAKKNDKIPTTKKTESRSLMDFITNHSSQSTLYSDLKDSISSSKFFGEAVSNYFQSQKLNSDFAQKDIKDKIITLTLLLSCQSVFLKFKGLKQLQSSLSQQFFNYFILNFMPNLSLHNEIIQWMKDSDALHLVKSNDVLLEIVSKFLKFCRSKFISIQVFDNVHKGLASSKLNNKK